MAILDRFYFSQPFFACFSLQPNCINKMDDLLMCLGCITHATRFRSPSYALPGRPKGKCHYFQCNGIWIVSTPDMHHNDLIKVIYNNTLVVSCM